MPVVVLVFVREKTRHARLVGNKNGIKLSQQEQNAPNWEILGVLGEFCTGTGGVPGVRGEFCTGSGGVPVVVLVFVREKTRHARLVGNKNGIKLSQQEQNAPNGEILGVQGEFCTGTGTVWLVWGEFCTGSGTVWLVLGEFCTGTAGPNSRGESVAPIVPPHSVDGGCEVGITKPPGAWPGGAGAGDGNRTRL